MSDRQILYPNLVEQMCGDKYGDDVRALVDEAFSAGRGSYLAELTRLRAENERLAGIVGKLPLLADGVRAVPGMTIYEVYGDHIQTHRNIGWITRDSGYVTLWFSDGHSALHEWNNCYSTLEAAEAARGKA